VHQPPRDDEHQREDHGPQHEREAQVDPLRQHATGERAGQHRHAADDLAAPEDRLEVTVEARRRQRVDEPRLDRAGEERESEPERE
jgi:hypothetical protein